MKKSLLYFLFFISDCDNPSDRMDIYAIVPVQACEDTYTLIKSESPNKNTMKLQERVKSLDIYGKDKDVLIAINTELQSGKLKSDGQLKGGMEFKLSFLDKKKQQSFEKEINWRQCYIYFFQGYFKNKKTNAECESSEGNKFIVENYKLILMYPECVKEKDKEVEGELRNMGDPYEAKIYKPQ
ncbi:hypothetical protein JT93_004561 [Salmonella enterica]|nr:hypothetical protein [Salmonella enterica]EDX3117399.1 hypothetical protein [Salmonella enterica subsp. enterica serovar Mississippi]